MDDSYSEDLGKNPLQDVKSYIGACMAQMSMIIDGGSTAIPSSNSFLGQDEWLSLFGETVVCCQTRVISSGFDPFRPCSCI